MSETTKGKPFTMKGRPSKYDPKYCQEMIEFFNTSKYVTTTKEVASQGKQVSLVNTEAASMPLFEDFAISCGIGITTLTRWKDEHKDFRAAYSECKAIQKSFLITHAMQGNYNASFAKFMAINNHGMRDSSHVVSDNTHEVKGYELGFDLSKTPKQIEKENKG